MGIQSTPQESNGDSIHSPAGAPVHPQSTKSLPYPTPKSPTHLETLDPSIKIMRSVLRKRRRLHWWGVEDEDGDEDWVDEDVDWGEEEEEEEDEEDEDDEVDDAERDRIWAILNNQEARLQEMADRCEQSKGSDSPVAPPLEMFAYPDLFNKAWGWDRMLPRRLGASWSQYKEYLSHYYSKNLKEADGDADDIWNGLAALANSCGKMEGHLLFIWDKLSSDIASDYPIDDRKIRRVSDMITKVADEMTNALTVEYPTAAVALECIIVEAELMCKWLCSEDTERILYIRMSNEIRHCALSFMTYKGPERFVAMAAMTGIMREAKEVCRLLRGKSKIGDVSMSMSLRANTLAVLVDICGDCCAVGKSAGGNPAGKKQTKVDKVEGENGVSQSTKIGSEIEEVKKYNTMGRSNGEVVTSDGSDNKSFSEKKPNEEEREEIVENTENCSMEDLVKGDSHADSHDSHADSDETNQYTKIGFEVEEVKKHNTMGRTNPGEIEFYGSAEEKLNRSMKNLEKEDSLVGTDETNHSTKINSQTERLGKENTMERRQKLRALLEQEDDTESPSNKNDSANKSMLQQKKFSRKTDENAAKSSEI